MTEVERELHLDETKSAHSTPTPIVSHFSPAKTTTTIKHDLDRPLTALFIACFHGNDEVVENLLQKGIVNERKPLLSGIDCIQVAATRDHARCVELLCKFYL